MAAAQRPHLHAYLVDEDDAALVLGGKGSQHPHSRAHEPRLCSHLARHSSMILEVEDSGIRVS